MAMKNSMKSYNVLVPQNEELHDAPALEFPDWSGMAQYHTRMTFEQAVQWNDELLELFGTKAPRNTTLMCDIPFTL